MDIHNDIYVLSPAEAAQDLAKSLTARLRGLDIRIEAIQTTIDTFTQMVFINNVCTGVIGHDDSVNWFSTFTGHDKKIKVDSGLESPEAALGAHVNRWVNQALTW